MSEQPPSAESLREWLRDSIMLHRSRPYDQDFVNEAMEHINVYVERVCEQHVSAAVREYAKVVETARAFMDSTDANELDAERALFDAVEALPQFWTEEDISAAKAKADEWVARFEQQESAPAERPAPPQQTAAEMQRETNRQWMADKLSLRGIGVQQPTQETGQPGCGTEAPAHPLDAEIKQALEDGERLGAQLRRDTGHDTLRDRIMYPPSVPSALASTGAPDEPLDYIGTEPPPVGYVRLGSACPRDAALRCSGCDETDVTPDMCGSGHPAYRSQKWIAWAGRPLPFPSALASTGEQPDKEEDIGKGSVLNAEPREPTAPSVDTARARVFYESLIFGDREGNLAKIAAALSAVACEHQAALADARHEAAQNGAAANDMQQRAIAAQAGHSEALAKLARLGEPEMREAVKRVISNFSEKRVGRIFPYGLELVQMIDAMADAALAVITEKLTSPPP